MGALLLQSLSRVARQLAFLGLLLVVVLAALLFGANTAPGRGLVVWGLERVSGGQVLLQGLDGRLPRAPRLERLELRDGAGAWLVMEEVALDLDPWALLRGEVALAELKARTLTLYRLPEGGGGAGPIQLPVPVRLDRLVIEDLNLDPAFAGAPRLRVEASGTLGGPGGLSLQAEVSAPERPDRYRLALATGPGSYRLDLAIQEAAGGLLPALAGPLGWRLPADLGAWRLDARAEGPPAALALTAALDAGALKAAADGLLDLNARAATRLHLEAEAPAMDLPLGDQRRLGWQALALTGDLTGPWAAPRGQARLEVTGLASGDLGLERLTLDAAGDRQGLRLDGELQGPQAPLDLPESALRVPLAIRGQVALEDPTRPFTLALDHPLLALAAEGELRPTSARASLRFPDLAPLTDLLPLAGLQDLRLAGSAELELTGTLEGAPAAQLSGVVRLIQPPGAQAPGPLIALLGPEARLALLARQDGDAWRLDSAGIQGARIRLDAQGTASRERLALGWALDLSDPGALAPGWSGGLKAQGGISGPTAAPNLAAELGGELAHGRLGAGRIEGRLGAVLAAPSADLELGGDWAGRPLRLDLRARRSAEGDLALDLAEGRWASLVASGGLRLAPGAALPQGELRLEAERLGDLAPLIALSGTSSGTGAGTELDGRLSARLRLEGDGLRLDAMGDGLTLPGSARIGALALDAELRDPWGAADAQGRVRVTGLALGTTTGDLALDARGTLVDLGLSIESALTTALGPTRLGLAGRLDAPARRLALQRIEAQVADQSLRLLAPATIDLAEGVAVDRLRLGLGPGTLELAGRLTPPLALDVRLARLPLELAALVAPDLPLARAVTGTLGGEIRLSGPIEALAGSLRLQAEGLRLTQGAGRGLPGADLQLAADLGPTATRIEATARAGTATRLALKGTLGGTLPFSPGALDLSADGDMDLALLDPLLTGGGRQAAGRAVLDARVRGTLDAPTLAGGLRLTNGAFWDRTIGLVLTQVQGGLVLAGDTLRLEGLSARAGPGTLALAGSVGVLAPGVPVDLRLTATKASPLQLDRLEVQGDGDVRLTGQALGRLDATGTLRLSRVDIRLPERLPANVVTLEVREVGERRSGGPRATARPPWRPDLGLDLLVSAPRSVTVRGRGVDAELGGEVRIQGTLAQPLVSGGFDLLRGDYNLVGQTLRFSRGRLGFDGATHLDPSLDLEARVTAAGSTAILAVQGTARAPRIALRGEPEMPQDEVLSRLLFGVAGARLSPWQAARLGLAAASLAGIEVEGPGVLDRLRKGLGLGRLAVGTDEAGGASLEGGRQLTERVYLGARQGTRTGEPQGVLRIEVSPRIQLEADVGPIGGTRAGAAFEIEY